MCDQYHPGYPLILNIHWSWLSTGPGDGTVQPEVLRGGNNSSYGRILG